MSQPPTSINVVLNEQHPTLLLVQQENVVLELVTPKGTSSAAGPRYQKLVAVLPEGFDTIDLTLKPKYQDNTDPLFAYQTSLLELGSADFLVASHLERSQILWCNGDEQSLARAVSELERAVQVEHASLELIDLCWFNIGLYSYQQFEFEKARQYYAYLSKGWWSDVARSSTTSWALAAVALEQSQDHLSRAHLDAAIVQAHLAESKGIDLVCDRLESQLYLGLVLQRVGEVEAGMTLLNESLALAKKINNNILVGKFNINIGGFYEFYNDQPGIDLVTSHESALKHYKHALNILQPTGIVSDTVVAELNVGRLKSLSGELQETLQHYQNALNRNRLQYNRVLRAYNYAHLGRIYDKLGDTTRAKYYVQRSYDSRKESGANRFKISIGMFLGTLERGLGDVETAIKYHQESLDFHLGESEARDIAESSYEVAEDFIAISQPNRALKLFDNLDMSFNDPFIHLKIHRAKAKALNDLGKRIDTKSEIETAIELAAKLPIATEHIETLFIAAEFYLDNDPTLGLEYANKAIDIIDSLRGDIEMSCLGTNFLAKSHSIFSLVAVSHLQKTEATQEDINQAISTLERGRANEFRKANIHRQQNESLASVKRKLSILSEKRIANLIKGVQSPEIDDAYYETFDQLSALIPNEVELEHVSNASNISVPINVPISQAILYYLSHGKLSYCIAMFAETKICHALEHNKPLVDVVAAFNQAVIENNTEDIKSLSKMIIPEALHSTILKMTEITIIPHGALHQLPFSALKNQQGTPLLSKQALNLAYSLSSITSKSQSKKGVLDLAIFADPEFSGAAQTQMRNWSKNLERLPWTAEEAKSIQATFPNLQCKTFTGSEANRSNLLREDIKSARILHIASHGFYDPNLTGIVGIALSTDDITTGFVGLTDLMDEGFCNDLVVISGCETGQGELLEGEGTLSIARAFLVQGVKNVVSTLWPVADRTSAIFMRYFYEALQENHGPASALSFAQDKLRESKRYQDPIHWAGYQLHTRELTDRQSLGDNPCI